ncbi:dihydroorotate dehydrogenase-like protein [Desulfobacterota bacterium AH_259_B03_O07]|nr:dihydroorotate dehydrogenase-like protein [Desulfobacterota bacterium AH_259_B03_O07]
MDLSTTYLGMNLRSPFVPSACPLSEEIDNIRLMEDSGASAVVLYSLFEEQLILERYELHHHLTYHSDSFAEALSFFPEPSEFHVGPEGYLDHIRKAKSAVDIPIIASLNGHTIGGWIDYAQKIEQAGADAIELNIYHLPTDLDQRSEDVEQIYVDILKAVKSEVKIPIALKLSPFFSNVSYMAKRFEQAGADALVLFNRFYQPDIDLEALEIHPNIILSTPHALRLPLTWIAILYGRVKTDLAATSGIHTAPDVLKMLMVGAKITMLCSVLFQHGIEQIRMIEKEMLIWMEEHEYESVKQMHGSMSQINCEDPSAFERSQYMRGLLTYMPTV